MKVQNRYTMETQAAVSHMFLRVLCLLIIEYECLQRILEATGQDYQKGNWLLASGFAVSAILCLVYPAKIWGYLAGIGFAIFNIAVKCYFVIAGHEHYPFWPIVWISQCLVIFYFCVKGIQMVRKSREMATPV